MNVARQYTACRYGQLHYMEGVPETPHAPTLILLHQNPSSSFEYAALLRAMASDRRVIAFDTPGYGMSDSPPEPLGMTDYAAAFSDAIDALDLAGPLDVYGFHTGTLLAAELALHRPDKVGRIAMTGIPMYDAAVRARYLEDARTVPMPTEDGAGILARQAAMWDYVVKQRDPRVPLERAALAFADKGRTLHRSAWAYQGVWSYDYERLRRIVQPMLLLQSHEDLLDVSRAAAAMIPRSTIVELPDLDRDIFDADVGADRIAAGLRAFFTPLNEKTS